MQANAQAEQLKLLRAAADGTLPKLVAQGMAEFSRDILRELYDEGMLTGGKFQPIDGPAEYTDLKITLRGRDRLAELEQLAVPDHAGQPANAKPPKGRKPGHEWHKNPYLIVSLIVVGGVLVVFVTYLMRHHLGIPL